MQKKSLLGANPEKQKTPGGDSGTKPATPVPKAKARKLAVAKPVTAKLTTAKLKTLRKLN